jgi:FkbM family methyltransferase
LERALKVIYEGKWWEFLTRTETGYDVTIMDEIVIREIFVENVYQVARGDLDDTGVVVDIGGNIGGFDVYCAALGAKAIHTFEPDSLNWGVLVTNIAANGLGDVIHPHNLGVAKAAGTAELVQGQGASFLVGVKKLTAAAAKHVDEAPKQAIETISLASVFADNGIPYCDILKIDCEGSEYGIIAGADPDVLAKARYITMEFHSASAVTFGRMVAKLSLTHNLHIIGRHNYGGQIYARRY